MAQLERIPPHNDVAEKSVLGSILQERELFFQVSEVIGADDFYSEAHKEIFQSMVDLYKRSENIDLITVCDALQKRKSLEAVGGRAYVGELSDYVPTTANAVQYANIIKEKSILRQLIKVSGSISEQCFEQTRDAKDVLDSAEKNIFEISKMRKTTQYKDIRQVLNRNLNEIEEAQKNGGKLPGLPTGFTDLDDKTSGLQKSDLIIIAARPSMGKTAFALNIAQNAAIKNGARVVIFSLEMSAEDLGLRMLSMQARVDSHKLRTGELSDEDWMSINDALDDLGTTDIIIDDTPGIGVMEIRNKCRRIMAEKPIDLIVVDYMQIMSPEKESDNRQNDVSMISRYLKQLAREMQCPVMVLSQLSRASEKRVGAHKPMLSDLRESGAIEQDADVVMFLHREDYYKDSTAEKNNVCEVIIAKQRKGATGSAWLTWMPQYTKFVNMAVEPKEH